MLLLFGSTSWLGCEEPLLDDELLWEPELCCEVPAPPGVRRIVLEGGEGALEPLPEDPPPPWHGCTAIVSVWAPFGTTTVFDPGGGFVEPGFSVCAWSHVGMTTVRSWCCAGITTWRTPGVIRAVETGSPEELLEELLLLPPHAVSPRAAMPTATATPATRNLIRISPVRRLRSALSYPHAPAVNGALSAVRAEPTHCEPAHARTRRGRERHAQAAAEVHELLAARRVERQRTVPARAVRRDRAGGIERPVDAVGHERVQRLPLELALRLEAKLGAARAAARVRTPRDQPQPP